MRIVGCDLHARQQSIAMVDTETGEFIETTLCHAFLALGSSPDVLPDTSMPNSSSNSKNHCIAPVASMPTTTGRSRAA
jgi:hypothetical protein